MPDVYAAVTELDAAMQERLATILESRGADPQQQAMRRDFLADVPFPDLARILEIGCGTGVLTRVLARRPGIGSVVGVDPAALFLDKARMLAVDLPNVTFQEADGRKLPFDDETFDAVVFDSVLSHVPGPEAALAEAARVLRPWGCLAVFDGDYATTTVALGAHDPLQSCVDAMLDGSVTDRRLMRRAASLVRDAGFEAVAFRSHGFVETTGGEYMLTIVERGVDILRASGQVGDALAAALKAEGRRRVEDGSFFGHIAYASLIARKPTA